MLSEIDLREELTQIIRWMNSRGWSPGTSTNYSFCHPELEDTIVISRSGVDKSIFNSDDFIHVNSNGEPLNLYSDFIPSAETLIHTTLYHLFPKTKFILHTHSKAATLMSFLDLDYGFVNISGYEVLKGLPNISTHETNVKIPIFKNDQDMVRFGKLLQTCAVSLKNNAFLMEKHGIYVWGETLEEVKRYLEIYEYLLDAELTLKQIK
jgi:methylthioribulose-1-phosphate dehydratase